MFIKIKNKAFTLIELLIVVAILAVLAAIAVPNFIEAQTRSKVSKVKADMRTLDTALSSYVVDHNSYPMCHRYGIITRNDVSEPLVLERLTTPVSYMTSLTSLDPFSIKGRLSAGDAVGIANDTPTETLAGEDLVVDLNSYIYQAFSPYGRSQTTSDSFQDAGLKAFAWILHSAGPDGYYHNLGGVLDNDYTIDGPILLIYDPTNGTSSFGSVYREGGQSGPNPPEYAGGQGLVEAIRTQN